tara:strand:- start:865 stop:1104 length:240 start_codon:yes stop_codon:yes gene_type:complete
MTRYYIHFIHFLFFLQVADDVATSAAAVKAAAGGGALAFFGKFAITGISAMAAESATFPIDLTKTRMQLAGKGETQVIL